LTQPSSDYPFPEETVTAATRAQLEGLLNDPLATTNDGVKHIRYTGAPITTDLEIPPGKVVYWDSGTAVSLAANIIVWDGGARLVLVDAFTMSTGKLLVRGTVEVFRSLSVGAEARNVADFTDEDGQIDGRNTVIGTPHVIILPGADLILDDSDIIPPTESLLNKFTPAQAWAAANQGNLTINGRLTTYPYSVKELLTGVNPSWMRTYRVSSIGKPGEILPNIPAGAIIDTWAQPEECDNDKLTVYGSLTTLGTLNKIPEIEVGSSGTLILADTDTRYLVTGLKNLKLNPGANFEVFPNPYVTFESLEELFLGDGSVISVLGGNVTFKQAQDTLLGLTIGKKVAYQVEMSPLAKIKTTIDKDGGLADNSTLILYEGSSFTVDNDVIFTIEGGSTFDISNLPIPATATTSTVPLEINGTLNIASDGKLIGPGYDKIAVNPENLYNAFKLGDKGKITLDYGATFYLGDTAATSVPSYTFDITMIWWYTNRHETRNIA
jgi:hypothetical protein